MFRFYLVLFLLSFLVGNALAESAMPYKYIEWVEFTNRNVPDDIRRLIIEHLREPYENTLEFAKKAPIYTPSVEYASFDVNKDGVNDVVGRIYSGSLCTRHTGCPTVVLIKRKDGTHAESFIEEVLGRLGVTDTGLLIRETRDFDFYKCEMFLLDERGYFNLQSGECTGDD